MTSLTGRAHSIRVLVADDSAFMRTALTRMIESDPGMRVVGTAQTGEEALEKTASLQPDVVTLDVEMPKLNGLETLKRIMQDLPRPVIMVSSLTREGADTTLEALDCGAFDYLPKQSSYASLDIVKIREDLVAKIRAAAESRRPRARRALRPATAEFPAHSFQLAPTVVALGTSTGGPKALQEILPMFPGDLPVPVLVVQHMPVGFTGPFAKRLNNLCKVTVREAAGDEVLEPGNVYIAPAGHQMTVNRKSPSKVEIRLSNTPSNTPHIPSVDVMMHSVASVYRGLAMGVIMTGMGADGALGMEAIRNAGGLTVGQDEASCTVYGMPRACAEMGILRRVVGLEQIPAQVLQAVGYRGKK
jgi:two-component system, chemotaxis family, protein-glutamate methylesterase/glutaminase